MSSEEGKNIMYRNNEDAVHCTVYTVPKVIDFSRYNTKCSSENEILSGIFRVVHI